MSDYVYRPNLVSTGAKIIPYNPAYRKIAKNVVGCIVFQQLEYWFRKVSGQPFFKFLAPCHNKRPLYRDGDSWTEELGISELEFRTAFDGIGIRYASKTEYLKAASEGREFRRGDEEVLYCSFHDKKTGLTYYVRNHRYVDERIASLLAVDEGSSSTVDEGSEPIEMRFPHLPYIYQENTTGETTTDDCSVVVPPIKEKEKDNGASRTVSLPAETDAEAVKKIIDAATGTPLEGIIPESVIPTLLMDYNPEAHTTHQPETAQEGVKRLICWTAAQMADAKAASISNPVAFLRARARKGMDKPQALIRAEQAAEAERREAEERRRQRERLEELRCEREIPPESREALSRLFGRGWAAV